jgi:EAL domain-containing protein (putative c-di-GMP-specific phosphodiesterase class I)
MISQFGVGDFNIMTLLSLRPDYLKFAPELIKKSDNPDIHFILSKLVESMHHLRIECIAQGVDDEKTLEQINGLDMDAFCGSLAGNIFEVTNG